jgi:murein DD-endopeptidase MepM/ murein hydrolase activator NlpD
MATGLLLAAAIVPAVVPAAPGERVHEIVQGDTLGALAKRYGVSVAAIVSANKLPSERVKLKMGQRLVIPPAAAPAAPRARTDTPTAKAAARGTTESAAKPVKSLARSNPSRNAGGPRAVGLRAPVDFILDVPDFADSLAAFLWPADGTVTSPFGRRRSGWHRGIDIRADRGEPVTAAAEGVVVVSGIEPRYGRVVKIEHEYNFVTVYAHNDHNLVEVGDWVVPGQRIGSVGRTGRATNFHVHFEIRRDGRVYNPLYMLPLPARIAHVVETENEGADD